MPEEKAPEIVRTDDGEVYARVDRVPLPSRGGLTVAVAVMPRASAPPRSGPQVALAHAQHATGWSLGLDATGRATLSVGTAGGPVGIRAGEELEHQHRYDLFAVLPGKAGGILSLTVVPCDGGPPTTSSVRVGAEPLPSQGPLLWGCRSLYDGIRPELPFDGDVADVLIVADAVAADRRLLRGHVLLGGACSEEIAVGRVLLL